MAEAAAAQDKKTDAERTGYGNQKNQKGSQRSSLTGSVGPSNPIAGSSSETKRLSMTDRIKEQLTPQKPPQQLQPPIAP